MRQLLNKQDAKEEESIKKIYSQVICLAIFAHASYVFIFAALSQILPSLYNIASWTMERSIPPTSSSLRTGGCILERRMEKTVS